MHIPYVHMHALCKVVYVLIDESQSCHLCCLSRTNSQGVGAGINMQPAYLSSAAHLEPVFMYKGEVHVCTGKFVFIHKALLITAGRINRGIVDINHYLMRFHHQVNLISGGFVQCGICNVRADNTVHNDSNLQCTRHNPHKRKSIQV